MMHGSLSANVSSMAHLANAVFVSCSEGRVYNLTPEDLELLCFYIPNSLK
ncbi:hypothetical protein Bca4012_039348 [Brassica carinata]